MGTRRYTVSDSGKSLEIPQNNNGTGSSERERVVMSVGSRGMEVMVRVVTELKNGETFCAVGQSRL